jgi:ACR3 family arsenite transporter
MSFFERWLTLWVFLCIVAGTADRRCRSRTGAGLRPPRRRAGQHPGRRVDLGDDHPDADEGRLRGAASGPAPEERIGITLFVNWAVKPFSMALLGWIFIRHVFAPATFRQRKSTATSPA